MYVTSKKHGLMDALVCSNDIQNTQTRIQLENRICIAKYAVDYHIVHDRGDIQPQMVVGHCSVLSMIDGNDWPAIWFLSYRC